MRCLSVLTILLAFGCIGLPSAAIAQEPLSTFKDCDVCPEMVVIPAGSFMMGSNEYGNEKPIHRVTIYLDKAFFARARPHHETPPRYHHHLGAYVAILKGRKRLLGDRCRRKSKTAEGQECCKERQASHCTPPLILLREITQERLKCSILH